MMPLDAVYQRQILVLWRVAFALYAIALTISTHWPRLQLGVGGMPAPNKIIHMIAFGGLIFMLWRTRWLGDGWLLLGAALAWSLIDELTQGLPGVERTVSWMDLASNWSGIVIVFAWIRALRPVGGPLNQMRQQLSERVIDELFTRWSTWALMLVAGVAMGAIVGGASAWIMWSVHPEGMMYAAFISVPAGAIGGAYLLLDALWRRERERFAEQCRCLFCGEACSQAEIYSSGVGACQTCSMPLHVGQWQQRAHLSRAMLIRLSIGPATLAIALSVLGALVYVAGVMLYMRFPQELQLFRRFDRLPMDLRLVFDMAVLGCIAAVAVYRFRCNLARVIDQQAERCLRCGHDVHATADEQGVGRCPECGTRFIRLDDDAREQLQGAY